MTTHFCFSNNHGETNRRQSITFLIYCIGCFDMNVSSLFCMSHDEL